LSGQNATTVQIEYLEKDFLDELHGKIIFSNLRTAPVGETRFVKICGIASSWVLSDGKGMSLRLFMEDIISGLYEGNIPLIFGIFGMKDKVEVTIGTFSGDGRQAEKNLEIIKTSLAASFEGIELQEQTADYVNEKTANFQYSGLVTGTPAEKVGVEKKEVEQIERVIRGLYGREYGYLVVATPTNNTEVNDLYNSVLNEMRLYCNSQKCMDSPIAKRYKKLLENLLNKLQLAKSQGLWHSAIFIFSNEVETLNHLKALTKTVFGGEGSLPDRIRTFDLNQPVRIPLTIINQPPGSPGQFRYPYSYMNTMNSKDLANFINLPTQEMPGFKIYPYARFNVSFTPKKTESISIGEIMDQGKKMGISYSVPLEALKKHGLIVGTTGSGKTNTVFYMLKEVWKQKTPFLVIEPAKTEYRSLLYSEEIGRDLNIFTLGDNNVSPFRINPFELMPGVSVQTHIDLLKSVFNASFFMWGPLPQVLERCIHEIYIDKGWDLTSNENQRGVHRNANPTLTDLYNKIDHVVDRLGYSSESTMEIRSALKTRINSMRLGGKGLMLDTRSSVPFEILKNKPTILELEAIGDDEEKSFIMGLILTMMYEYYVSKGLSEVKGLEHLTVIEEAHRLLAHQGQDNPYAGNMRGKSVETFMNILSEIRAYGEGFLIVEQIPAKLAIDVIKNTNLKVMHRIVADDDRKVMGATMNIQERETKKVTSMNVGEAAVYSEGDEGAYHIKAPYSKIDTKKKGKEQEEEAIRKVMETFTSDEKNFAPFEGCTRFCKSICRFKSVGTDISLDHKFSSQMPTLVLAILDDAPSAESVLLQMLEMGGDEGQRAGDPKGVKMCAAIQGAERYFEELGTRYNLPYKDVENLKESFLDFYMDALGEFVNRRSDFALASLDKFKIERFRAAYRDLCTGKQPTEFCRDVCEDTLCLYRLNLSEALEDNQYHERFIGLINEGGDDLWKNLYASCKQVAEAVLPDGSADSIRKIALCFALQKCHSMESLRRDHIVTIMENLIDSSSEAAGLEEDFDESVGEEEENQDSGSEKDA
jgi:hypothetical protein